MYVYEEVKKELFTEEGSVLFTAIRDNTLKLLNLAGAVSMDRAYSTGRTANAWTMLACVDRLVETGEIREITQDGTFARHRIFFKA